MHLHIRIFQSCCSAAQLPQVCSKWGQTSCTCSCCSPPDVASAQSSCTLVRGSSCSWPCRGISALRAGNGWPAGISVVVKLQSACLPQAVPLEYAQAAASRGVKSGSRNLHPTTRTTSESQSPTPSLVQCAPLSKATPHLPAATAAASALPPEPRPHAAAPPAAASSCTPARGAS